MASTGVILSSSLSDYQTQINDFIASYKKSISTPITNLNSKKDVYTQQKTAISDLTAKLKKLTAAVDDLTASDSSSKFKSNTITSSDSNAISVTSTGISTEGNYAVSVKQLAKYDKVVSSSLAGDEESKFAKDKQKMSINIAGNSYDIEIDLSDEKTNLSALRKIMNTINASDAGTKVKATMIQDTESTYRLVLTSKETGSKNAIALGGDSKFLKELGIVGNSNSRTLSSGSNGGYLYADTKQLDSIFSVDGIQMTRSGNKISDVISGVTFELKSTQSTGEKDITIGVSLDKNGIKSLVENFISSYNETLSYLTSKVAVSTSGSKSEFSGDTTLMDLRQKMRSLIVSQVGGITSNVKSLADIGITINANGTMTLKDTNKFNSVMENNVEDIANLFGSSSGIGTKLKDFVGNYTKANGILDRKTSNIETQISAITTRITNTQTQIDKKTEKVKADYEKLLSVMLDLNNQQALMNQITSSYNVSY